jgi:predicted RND superfamily exporter protein
VADQILSRDGRTLLAVARLAGTDIAVSAMQPTLDAIGDLARELTADSDVRARLTGVPPLRAVIFREIGRELGLFSGAGCLLALLVGASIFRSLWAVGAILCTTSLVALWSAGLMGWVGQPLNLLTSGLPLLVLVVALTDTTHLVLDVQRSLRAGLLPAAAARRAVTRLAGPCLATSLTTAVGFGTLALSRVETVRAFGLLSAVSIALAFLVVATLVPLWVSFLSPERKRRAVDLTPAAGGRAESFVRWVVRRARGVTTLSLLACVGLVFAATRLEADNSLTESMPRGSEAELALRHCEQVFGGVLQAAVRVDCPGPRADGGRGAETLAVFGEVEALLEQASFTHGVLSPAALLELLPPTVPRDLDALELMPRELVHAFWRADLARGLVRARVPDVGSRVAVPAWNRIERELTEVEKRHPGFELSLSGSGWLVRRNIDLMIEDFAQGLALAVVLILVVLSLTFRSWRLGAISILPNALPLLIAAAFLLVVGLDLQAASAIAFTIALGIAVDDTIHFMSRLRAHERSGESREAAVVSSFVEVISPLIATTLIVIAGVSVFLLSAIPTTRTFAAITCSGLGAALLGDLIVLPAALVAFKRSRAGPRAPSAATDRS